MGLNLKNWALGGAFKTANKKSVKGLQDALRGDDVSLTSSTDNIINEKELVDSAPDVLKFAEKEISEQGTHGKDAMLREVYPEGNEQGILQRVGNKVTGTGRVLGDAPDFLKEAAVRSLGGAQTAENIAAKHAKSSVEDGGLMGAELISESPGRSFSKTIGNEIDVIDNQFTSRFNMIGDLKTKTNPNFVLEEVTKVINKYKNDKYFATGEEGKAIIGGMNKHLTDLIEGQYKSQTEMLRALRRFTGERKFKANTENIAEKHTISSINDDVRKAFMKAVERKGQSRKKLIPVLKEQRRKAYVAGDEAKVAKIDKQIEFNKNFLGSAKKLDKEFSAYKSLQSKAKPGSGKLDAVDIFKTLGDPVAADKLLKSILTDAVHGPNLLIKFRSQISAIEKTSGNKGLLDKANRHLQDAFAHRLFKADVKKNSPPPFLSFMTNKDGRAMMKAVWPESKKMIDQWKYVLDRTKNKDEAGSFVTRMLGTYLGSGLATGMALSSAGLTAGLAAGGGVLTMSLIAGLLHSKPFQNFAIRQFSKNPYKKYEALGKLGDIIEKAGGDRVLSKRVLDSIVGAGVVGGAGYAGTRIYESGELNNQYDDFLAITDKKEGIVSESEESKQETHDEYEKFLEDNPVSLFDKLESFN